ncbi:MAG: hypothetical protein IPP04_06945 [Saprospiraceae bacterium]|nr:hypothetical protein [Saprospiraceae bacterium]
MYAAKTCFLLLKSAIKFMKVDDKPMNKAITDIIGGIRMPKLASIFAGIAMSALPFTMKAQTASTDNKPATKTEIAAHNVAENKAEITNPNSAKNAEPIVLVGDVGTAIDASYRPDTKYVSVYMVVGKDCPKSADYMIPKLQTFFDGYGLPVKFIKQAIPNEGKGFMMRLYVGGQSYIGDLPNGNVSFPEFRDNHPKIFASLKDLYARMNPELSLALIPGAN